MLEAIFLEILLIWHSQERFPLMWIPRDFEVDTCLIGNLLISVLWDSFLVLTDLYLDPIINKNSVLVVFSELYSVGSRVACVAGAWK